MLSKNRLEVWLAIFLLSLMLFASCTDEQEPVINYHVDPRFREIYNPLVWDGTSILGKPISSLIHILGSDIEKQYFENGVLVYNPEVSPRFYLEALDLITNSECSSVPAEYLSESDVQYVNGYILSKNFSAIYNEFGARWLGKPTTNTCWSPEKRRLEQHFENIGLYQFEDDAPDVVRFIPYGVQKCANVDCQSGLDNTTHQNSPPPVVPTDIPQEKANIELAIWEYLPQISSAQPQQFAACVSGNAISVQDFTVELKVFLPSGGEKGYQFPAADENGCSFLIGEAIEAQNGTTIEYWVCVIIPGMSPFCEEDSFLIEGNP